MTDAEHSDRVRDGPDLVRVAAYVRMSTDLQRYSTENQADAIQAFATRRAMEVVRTFADEGKSGLTLEGRGALQQLSSSMPATPAAWL